ncbi:MAG: transporter substrate-binding domain-containing protein [Clostridia bacterium]|nr:transporter substrate-binding domain-containing protein [Clostridia bacterium]
MKKILALLLALSMVFALGACAKEPAAEKTDAEYITEKGEMIIGITLFAPMNYYNEKNELIGFETEFAKAVCEKLGVTAKFQEINWAAKETELNGKTIDCIWNGMTIDAERLENMSISTPYMQNKQVLIMKADKAAAFTSIDGLKIAAEGGSAGANVIENDAYFANAQFVEVEDMAAALMEVKAGTSDGCVIDYVTSLGSIGEGTDYADLVVVESAKFELGNDEQYGIAFRKGSDMTAKVNAAITELVADGTLQSIAAKYKLENELIAK